MKRLLLEDWLKKWMKEESKLMKESSYATFDLHIQNHIIPYFKDCELADMNNQMLQDFIFYLYEEGRLDKKGGLSVSTIRDIVSVIKLAYKDAVRKNLIEEREFYVKYPKESGDDDVVVLTSEEERKLIQAIYLNLNSKTVGFLISAICSLRIGELCALQWKDIDLNNRTISVTKTLQRIYRKGEKSKIVIGPAKTETSIRIIPIPSQMIPILTKIYTKPTDYVLTGKKKYTEPRTYRRFYKSFMEKNGLPIIKFHCLRHTFAIRAIENPEFDIKSLAYIMGHKNPSFTLNKYGRSNLNQSRICMESMNKFL